MFHTAVDIIKQIIFCASTKNILLA